MKQLFLSHRSTRIALSLVALLTFSLFGSTAAFAADPSPIPLSDTVVAGGNLTVGGGFVASSASINPLSSATQTPMIGTFTITTSDYDGTGKGWNINTSASKFASLTTVNSKPLDTVLTPQTVTADNSSNLAEALTHEVILSGGANLLANASVNTGMGTSYTIPYNVTVTIPPNSYAGTYKATIDLTISTAIA